LITTYAVTRDVNMCGSCVKKNKFDAKLILKTEVSIQPGQQTVI